MDPFGENYSAEDGFTGSTEGADGAQFEGPHLVRCIGVKADTSAQGNDMLVFDMEVVMDSERDTANAGETLLVYCAQTSAAAWKMKETLVALGVMGADDEEYQFNRGDVVGVYAVAEVELSEYQGKKRPSIATLTPHKATKKGNPYRGDATPDAPSANGSGKKSARKAISKKKDEVPPPEDEDGPETGLDSAPPPPDDGVPF